MYHLQHYSSLSNIHAGWNNCMYKMAIFYPTCRIIPSLFLKISKHAEWKKGMQVAILSKNNKICCRIIRLTRVLYQWKQGMEILVLNFYVSWTLHWNPLCFVFCFVFSCLLSFILDIWNILLWWSYVGETNFQLFIIFR